MKIQTILLYFILLLIGCTTNENQTTHQQEVDHEHEKHTEIHFSQKQFKALGIKVDTLAQRLMTGFVETNGQLTLPPQSQATVTSIIGANVSSIEVIEGNQVDRGQVLAYLYHPNLIELQTEYAHQLSQLEYLEKEYKRQEKLYDQSVGSGRDFQKTKADYLSLKASVNGMEGKLKLLSISPEAVKRGEVSAKIPLKSPIKGYVQNIAVRTGQFVAPEEIMFEVIQTDHIHAHFKVFESDVSKIKEGQAVHFIVESEPTLQHQATIFSVGKTFETEVKAVNVHAELDNEDGSLLPGMYVRGKVAITDRLSLALPKEAIAMDGERHYIFMAEQMEKDGELEWHFSPVEISVGVENNNWLEVKLHEHIDGKARFAWNNAYYLISELKKEEVAHDH
jgi:cobalt-zinc-cadmium efflux system membrane fusion protein